MPLGGINHEHTSTISFKIKKGEKGFGFTVADSTEGQQVKQVVESDRYYCLYLKTKLNCVFRCGGLQSDDLIVAIDGSNVQSFTHEQLVIKLKSFPVNSEVILTIRRPAEPSPSSIASRNCDPVICKKYI